MKSTECPNCGTSLMVGHDRTQLKSRYDDSAGLTIDDSADEDLPFVRDKRTAPHQAIAANQPTPTASPPVRRGSGQAVLAPVSDSTIPFKGGPNGVSAVTRDTGPSLAAVPGPDSRVPTLPPEPVSASMRRVSAIRQAPPTERAPAVRLDAATPQLIDGPSGSHDTQPGLPGPGQKKDALIGTRLGEYVVEERVGIGGMGIVYRAVQPLIGNSVAIKVLRPDVITDENDLQRFLGEARTVNSIRHRSIISIFGAADTPDGRKYLVMEYLEGESLEARLQREGRLPTADALPILEDVLSALAAAHAANVVHRDLKPANVFLVHQSDGRPWVKLLDFGLARGANKQDVSRIAGTPDYISPEHARGRPAGPPSDLYAFGVLAFHLLTGKLPFVGNTPMEVMEQHVHKPPPVPHEIDDTIPLAMSHLILRLLDKEPVNRPDAKTVKADLKAAAKELRQAQTQVGPRPSNPNVSGDTILRGPPTPIAAAEELPLDPRLARRAIEADRARQGWLARNWPWVAGALALLWLLTVALYLLTRPPPPAPDNQMKPLPLKLQSAPRGELPDTTGAETPDPGPAPNPAAADPLPAEPDAAPEGGSKAEAPPPSGTGVPTAPPPSDPAPRPAHTEKKPKRNVRAK